MLPVRARMFADRSMTDALQSALWVIGPVVAAVLVGGVIALGEPLPALIVTGFLAGAVLVAYPRALLWVALVYGLVGIGLLNEFARLEKADWLLSAIGCGFWLVAVPALVQRRERTLKEPAPAFLIWLALFFALALVTSVVRFEEPLQLLIGLRGYLVMFGVTLALWAMPWDRQGLQSFATGALVIGLLQLPVTLFQYVFVRGWRLATGGRAEGDSAVEASDSVFGTMGGNALTWGLDDLLALVLCALLAGVLARWRDGGLSKRRALVAVLALVVPLFLSENKIIIVFLPLVVMIVFGRGLLRRPLHLVATVLCTLAFVPLAVIGYYHVHWSSQYASLEDALEKMTEYSVKPVKRTRLSDGDMSRADAIEYWADQQTLADPAATLFGYGLAASKWASGMFQPRLVNRHDNRRLDKSGLSALLWDTGVLGTLLFLGGLVSAFRLGGRLATSTALSPGERAIVRAAQAAVLFALLLLPLKGTLLTWAQAAFVLFLALGLIAYYARLVKRAPALRTAGTNGSPSGSSTSS